MGTELQLRAPLIRPYFRRFFEHSWWGLKSIFMPRRALAQRVSGKVVLLTGASSGIGEQAARKLAAAGATVLMTARSKDKLEALANEIRDAGGKAHVYAGNLSNMEDCDRICLEALSDHGRVDILINNAGRSIRRSVKYTFDRFHDYERVMQLNFFGTIRMAMNLLPGMLARNEGHIVNVSTLGVQTCPARFSAYLSSKWALDGWSHVTSNEIVHTGVRISTINYPLVRTPMIAPTKLYKYMPGWGNLMIMSPETAVRWLTDVLITRNKRKVSIVGPFAIFMYYLFPETSQSFINLTYQVVHEPPPPNYGEVLQKATSQWRS